MKTIDLNCDMGEGSTEAEVLSELAMLDIVSSANVSCGAHAGDARLMSRVMQTALDKGVAIGAHPGFEDRANFGRTEMTLSPSDLTAMIRYQVAASDGVCRALGGSLSHLKLHGAMANMASRDEDMALTCYRAARSVCPDLPLMVIAGTAQARAAAILGGPVISEIFADRSYESDGTLTPRGHDGAVIHDPEIAATRILQMLEAGAILPRTGDPIPVAIDTICVHGDTAGAVAIAQSIRDRLTAAGYSITAK
ncbi:MAG: LamB/YcsF family protein [Marivivens sp.]|uniref:LamB/YcsF family protein n=1 Tax=Marivivens sp. TaxID=1978374 RepID=UPI00183BFB18|nr:5-oxoprolinase subunit PxpA [Marivivens sp.]NVJ96077.1 LamB/YcsF family protein [Marivivens sp.]